MSGFLWKMAGSLVALMVGLAMLFWALELTSLAALQGSADGGDGKPETGVYLLMFAGLVILNLATFSALMRWSRYLRENPSTKQLPVAVLVAVLLFAGAALIAGVAIHSDWLGEQPEVPTTVQQGFIFYQMIFATIAVATLVLLAVRWSPGYKRRPIED
jgi:hypothetical protein